MNKQKLFKIIAELRANIESKLSNDLRESLYIRSWVIGQLDMIESKARGEKCYIYPYNATYSYLLYELKIAFYCERISEDIEAQAKAILLTDENIKSDSLERSMYIQTKLFDSLFLQNQMVFGYFMLGFIWVPLRENNKILREHFNSVLSITEEE